MAVVVGDTKFQAYIGRALSYPPGAAAPVEPFAVAMALVSILGARA